MALLTTHDVELYMIGGAIVYVAPWDGDTPPDEGDFYDVGNATNFSFEVQVTKVKHPNSRGSTRTFDDTRVSETGYTVSFTLDEHSIKNWAMLVKGTISENTILGLQDPQKKWAVRIIENNGDEFEAKTVDFWKCELGPSGGTNLIDLENYKELPFTGEGLADDTNHPTSPLFTITFAEPTA